MLDILLDAGLDSVKMLPFLYLAYLLIARRCAGGGQAEGKRSLCGNGME